MDRRSFVNFSSIFAATTLAGCGGGDTPEFTPAKLEETDATGPEIAREDRAAIQAKGSVPRNLVPARSVYDVEITYLTAKAVTVTILPSGGTQSVIGQKSAGSSTNNALGFASYGNDMSPDPTTCRIVVGGATPITIGGATWQTYADYRNIDSHGRSCSEWTIYDPQMPVTSTSAAVVIRFYEVPADQRPLGVFLSVVARQVTSNVTHTSGSGQVMVMPHLMSTSVGAPQHQSQVIRSPSNNLDTLMIPSDPTKYPGHYAMVPHMTGASAQLKPHLGRHLTRHSARLGAHSATVHGVVTSISADSSQQFSMMANEKAKLFGGQGAVDRLQALQSRLGGAMSTIPPHPSVSSTGFKGVVDSILPLFSSELEQALSAALVNSFKSTELDNGLKAGILGDGVGTSITASAQIGGSYTSKTGTFLGIPISGAGFRISAPLGSAYAFTGQGAVTLPTGSTYYGIGRTDETKLAIVLIIKLFDMKTFLIGDLSIDIEITINLMIKSHGGVRIDSVNVELIADTQSKNWMAKVIKEGVEALMRKPLPAGISNGVRNVATASNRVGTASNLEMMSRRISATGTTTANPLSGGPEIPNLVNEAGGAGPLSQAKGFTTTPSYFNDWNLIEGYFRLAFVNTSVASGTFQGGWHGFAFGIDIGIRFIMGVGSKIVIEGPTSKSMLYVRILVSADFHGYCGSQAYMDASRYLPHAA